MSDLTERLERLTPAQRRLLELRRRRRESGTASTGAVPVAPDTIPLTPEQEAARRRYRWTPRTFYNWGLPLRLIGPLDVPALEAALGALMTRHDALRARIVEEGGALLQRIAPPQPVSLPVVDFQHVPEADRDAAARAHVVEFVGQRLDPEEERLWRLALLRLHPEEHVLVLLVDELLCDDRSRAILMREVLEVYEARLAGRPPLLAELPVGYAEYIGRRRRWLAGAEAGRQADGWLAALAGAELLPLPGDHPRAPERTFRGSRLFYEPSTALVRGLHALTEREGVTLYMLLLAAYTALLTMEAGRTDVVVTTHVFNRLDRGSENLVGNFLTHLLVRCRWSGDPTFGELLRIAREATLATYARKEFPVWNVIDRLGWADFSLRSPMGQLHLVAHDDVDPLPAAPGTLQARFEPVYLGRFPGEIGLYTYHRAAEDRLRARFEWDVALFEEATILRLRDRLDDLLARAVAGPERRLSTLLSGLSWSARS